jgi:CheY-like chemotaxis protein
VLLADDHPQVLTTVSAILADEFDIVGVATDGRQALDRALQIAPEAIVLDVTMPGLDGFQTCRALREAGLRAPVVFMSMHSGDDYVTEGFRSGGRGYVLKSRAQRDLPAALDQALLGRVFVPSLTSLFGLTNGSGHATQIHGGTASFLDGVATFIDFALRRGDASCVIATKPIREGLGDRLRARGWDVSADSGHKRYLVVDATDALNRFMRSGLPDADRLSEIAVELDQYRLAVAEGATPRLTIFGNMAEVLLADGNAKAAIALERLWSTQTQSLPFFTLCGYGTSCFREHVPDLWSDVRNEHWALSHAGDA